MINKEALPKSILGYILSKSVIENIVYDKNEDVLNFLYRSNLKKNQQSKVTNNQHPKEAQIKKSLVFEQSKTA